MSFYPHRIALQRNEPTQSARGAKVDNWIDEGCVMANVLPGGSREFYGSQQVNAEITHEAALHFRADVKSSWQVIWGTQTFAVVGPPINVAGRNRELKLMLKVINA